MASQDLAKAVAGFIAAATKSLSGASAAQAAKIVSGIASLVQSVSAIQSGGAVAAPVKAPKAPAKPASPKQGGQVAQPPKPPKPPVAKPPKPKNVSNLVRKYKRQYHKVMSFSKKQIAATQIFGNEAEIQFQDLQNQFAGGVDENGVWQAKIRYRKVEGRRRINRTRLFDESRRIHAELLTTGFGYGYAKEKLAMAVIRYFALWAGTDYEAAASALLKVPTVAARFPKKGQVFEMMHLGEFRLFSIEELYTAIRQGDGTKDDFLNSYLPKLYGTNAAQFEKWYEKTGSGIDKLQELKTIMAEESIW